MINSAKEPLFRSESENRRIQNLIMPTGLQGRTITCENPNQVLTGYNKDRGLLDKALRKVV